MDYVSPFPSLRFLEDFWAFGAMDEAREVHLQHSGLQPRAGAGCWIYQEQAGDRCMMWFDKFSCKRSDLVITVGRDLVETVENRFKGKKFLRPL